MGKDTFQLAGRDWPKVIWWKQKNMRTLYLTLWAALLTSATNGENTPSASHLEIVSLTNFDTRIRWLTHERTRVHQSLEREYVPLD